jgi:hypothetical protein
MPHDDQTRRYLRAALQRVPGFREKLAAHVEVAREALEAADGLDQDTGIDTMPGQDGGLPELEDALLQPLMPDLEEPDKPLPAKQGSSVLAQLAKLRARRPNRLTLTPAVPAGPPALKGLGQLAREMRKKAAWIQDVRVSELPESVRHDLVRFLPADVPDPLVMHYGMTVNDLLPRVDPNNWKVARTRVRDELHRLSKPARSKEVGRLMRKVAEKYVFLVNDRIVDGHHFLARADELRVSSSLNVLDLTPVRFQIPPKKK